MCILNLNCKSHKRRALTVLEIIIVIVIFGLIIAFSTVYSTKQIEREHADKAKDFLKTILLAEKNLFAWKDTYTGNYSELAMDDPNPHDDQYVYQINYSGSNLVIKATRKNSTHGFQIDENGNISEF